MKALVVIDIDHYDGWSRGFEKDEHRQMVASAIQKTLCQARSASIPIIFTVFPNCEVKPESAWHNRISPEESRKHLPTFLEHRHNDEPRFFKKLCNAFENPSFAKNLRARGIDELLLTGCSTYGCVKGTVRGAAYKKFEAYVLEECIYPRFKDENEKAMWLNQINDVFEEKSPIFVHIIKTIEA